MKDKDKVPYRKDTDFSLVLGGPFFQLLRRTYLCGSALQWLRRRVVVFTMLAWLPLLLLSAAQGLAWTGVRLPFLYDIETHVRFLFALPLVIIAELVIHRRLGDFVRQFLDRGLVPDSAREEFDAAHASAVRLRNSYLAEGAIFALVYGVGTLLVWRSYATLGISSWYGVESDGRLHPSWAGWWLGCVSLPLFQFLLIRWYFRLFIWTRFLWRISRIDLEIVPTHPDRAGGLGFLGRTTYAFTPLVLAQGALLAGMMANRIFFMGALVTDFKAEVVGLVVIMILGVLGPTTVFSPRLARAKRSGLLEYGHLAQRYVSGFDRKWLRGGAPPDEPLVGSADIQSLADLGGSYDALREMRFVPFNLMAVVQVAVASLLPALPLLLTMFSLEDLANRVLKILF